jgi:hypothetical protein
VAQAGAPRDRWWHRAMCVDPRAVAALQGVGAWDRGSWVVGCLCGHQWLQAVGTISVLVRGVGRGVVCSPGAVSMFGSEPGLGSVGLGLCDV